MLVLTVLGIALPSIALVAALRRWISPVPWPMAALFLAMTLLFLGGAVFTSKLPVPVDEIARGYPWRGVVGEPVVRNPLTNDTVKLFLPWMAVAREELAHLRAPLWNRYSFSGYPLLGNGESAPFSPFFLTTLFVPLPKQIVAMAGLKIFVSLLFGYLFVRRLGASDAAAAFAATAFSWSVFQTVFLYYSTTAVTALLPAALFAVFLSQEEASRRGVVLLALVVGSLMAGGHPESVWHIAIAAAVLLAIALALSEDRRRWLRNFTAPLAGAIAGLALSAPAWLPVLEQVFLSTRLEELRHAGGHPPMYPLTAIWAMVSPNGFGNPLRHNWSWILNYSSVAGSYTGLVVLALCATALLAREVPLRFRVWIGAAVLLWLIAMSWSPLGRGLNSIPPFSVVANDKLRFAALFIASAAAACAADRMRSRRSAVLAGASIAAAGAAVYVYVLRTQLLRPSDLVPPVVVVLFAAVSLALPRFTPVAAFAAIAVELFVLNSGFNALVDARYDRPELPIVAAIERLAPGEPFRIAGLDWMFPPNSSARYGLEDIRGSDPMSYAAYTALLKPVVVDDPSIDFDRVVNVDHPVIDRLGVRFLLAAPRAELGGRWARVYAGPDGTLFENRAAFRRFFVRSGDASLSIRQLAPSHLRLHVDARTAAEIGSSQVGIRGWSVRGARRRDDGIFIGLVVPPGRHVVDIRYVPATFYRSLLATAVAAAFLALRRWPR